MNALLIIDLQNDFLPGGALPAPEGNRIIPVINRIMKEFDVVIASRDWHPPDTLHFNHWSPHCIRDTEGAAFPGEFLNQNLDTVFLKGTGSQDDGYSAFDATNADLQSYLEEHDVNRLFLAGLTTEYCVKATALEAVSKNILTFIVKDAVAAVGANPGDGEKAMRDLELVGVIITDSLRLKQM
ncbi:MAG: isochorismatase family protein [Bacteroidota bacterium]|nr:isochorismatase family protein [Bacteroidota bacterium]